MNFGEVEIAKDTSDLIAIEIPFGIVGNTTLTPHTKCLSISFSRKSIELDDIKIIFELEVHP